MSFNLALALGNETDRLALLALKDQLVDGSPGALISWNASLHFCEWQGVRCGRQQQRVISLKLNSMKLGGSISPSIGNLSLLREANLSDNSLQGQIPREFGQLRRLRFLNLSYNNLQGNLPMELTNCSNLQLINLNHNSLSGKIPFSFGDDNMKNLTRLSLANNNLIGGIPPSLGNLSSLDYLQLAGNHLEGAIPNTLGRISNLKILVIGQNNLSGTIPSSIYNLSSMTYIDMGTNKLSGGLAPEIGFAFPKLEILYIGDNQFTGTIPKSVTNISGLQQFDIQTNGFSGSVPDNMGNLQNLELFTIDYNHLGIGNAGDLDFLSSLINCSQLTLLAIHENRLGGVLPDSVANLSTQLDLLYMGGNRISGTIPEGIGNLVKLTQFHIGINLFTGNIPTSIGKLQNLGRFDLSVNRFSGEIPSSIGNLSQLSYLYLNDNNFEGGIPLTLRKCKRMQIMDLSQNKLGGSIPDQLIAGFESLITLNMSHNAFTGVFPADIGNSKNLVELRVDNNNFIGEIPKRLGEISGLRILHMQGNDFQGSIPLSFGFLRGLENLDLSGNNLSGTIPVDLQNLPFLVSLNLSFNQLEGEVPQKGVFNNTSEFSIVGNKELCGGIPEIKLPKCINQAAKKKGKVLSTKVIFIFTIGIPLASILVVLLVFLRWRKCFGRENIPVPLLPVGYLRVSYKELLQATNGFASSNCIGSGSFGSVYKGILHQHKNPVAVKVLNLQNLGAVKSFTVECEALRKIRHRNLVKLITSCSSIDFQGIDFKALVLEFMPNGSLDSWLHDQQYDHSRHLSFGQMLDIAIDVANALDYLHHHCGMLIVHRDLKPTNVLLDDDMVAHVSDFGMAKLLSGAASNNRGSEQATSSVIKGTIGYLAPEYGMGCPTSPQGDIYSYGILLLEMISGKRPTYDLFHDGLSLHNFCKMALPEQLEEILDVRLLQQINETNIDGEIWECLVSFTRVGVACSIDAPVERMKIEDAITELHAIKARFHAQKQVVP
ncbi:putative receptor-like protein kinase At3g47110 [Durio zibethinus]|uniref:non-specific serine/threonine protein kinase n=1 Tax=Durio zibethinus TaxID=66656 RepID=A0A6P5Z328_DURZI|nr:putative receptor-like protein kinase At3g47110 [Durio zibethinus]